MRFFHNIHPSRIKPIRLATIWLLTAGWLTAAILIYFGGGAFFLATLKREFRPVEGCFPH